MLQCPDSAIVTTPMDGSCLFHAIGLYPNDETGHRQARDLRESVVEYLSHRFQSGYRDVTDLLGSQAQLDTDENDLADFLFVPQRRGVATPQTLHGYQNP